MTQSFHYTWNLFVQAAKQRELITCENETLGIKLVSMKYGNRWMEESCIANGSHLDYTTAWNNYPKWRTIPGRPHKCCQVWDKKLAVPIVKVPYTLKTGAAGHNHFQTLPWYLDWGGESRIASSLAETETWCLQHDGSLQYDWHINIPSAELKNNVHCYQPLDLWTNAKSRWNKEN